jgi:hypothetical protein
VSAPERDPLVDPVRGDVISYGVKDSDSLFVLTVCEVMPAAWVFAKAVELHGGGADLVSMTESLNKWRDWSDFTDVTILRRGGA